MRARIAWATALASLIVAAPAAAGLDTVDDAALAELLRGHRGKVVLVDYWATWCPPCKMEIPAFVELYDRFRDRGLEILGISLDTDPAKVEKFLRKHNVDYPVYLGTRDLKRTRRISIIPTTVLYGRDGRAAATHVGYQPPKVFAADVTRLLDEPPP